MIFTPGLLGLCLTLGPAVHNTTLEKSTLEKSTLEKSTLEKSTLEKSTLEKSTLEKSIVEKLGTCCAQLSKAVHRLTCVFT